MHLYDPARVEALRAAAPLVHCISNIVTAHDCAALALAAGASPMMAQAPAEVAGIAARAGALVLNTGTPGPDTFGVCAAAAAGAAGAGVPIVLDPVGVGASPWRLAGVQTILRTARPALVRANWSEARALLEAAGAAGGCAPEAAGCAFGADGRTETGGTAPGSDSTEHGVDSAGADQASRLATARALARQLGAAVLLSGPADIVTDGARCRVVRGGSPLTRSITGAGCMLSVLCGAFAAVTPDPVEAGVLAAAFWKMCAARAEVLAGGRGLGSFHVALFDAAGAMTGPALAEADVAAAD